MKCLMNPALFYSFHFLLKKWGSAMGNSRTGEFKVSSGGGIYREAVLNLELVFSVENVILRFLLGEFFENLLKHGTGILRGNITL